MEEAALVNTADRVDLERALADRISDVDARVIGGGRVYEVERTEARLAAETVRIVIRQLGLDCFAHPVGPRSGKPQFVLAFGRWNSDQPVVLKAYGRHEPAEAEVQALWYRAGVPTAKVLAAGNEPTSWLLMPLIDGSTLPSHDAASTSVETTLELARIMSRAHAVPLPPSCTGDVLFDAIAPHLNAVCGVLRAHRYDIPVVLQEQALEAYRAGSTTVLHGDLAPGNLMVLNSDRSLVLLDARGYRGDAAFDAARWCARSEDATQARRLLDLWCQEEAAIDPELAQRVLAAELLMQAGVREIVKAERGLPIAHDETTANLVAAAA